MATTEQNKELIRRTFGTLNEQDRDGFTELLADDVVFHDTSEDVRGLDAVVEYHWNFFEAFPDLEFTVEDLVEEDDEVAFRFTTSGTHEGAFRGIEPTGKEVEISEMGIVHVEDGECAEVWIQGDELGLLEQLGVVERPTE
jgi:steroid delta-isomerase-like uncharacterized protein